MMRKLEERRMADRVFQNLQPPDENETIEDLQIKVYTLQLALSKLLTKLKNNGTITGKDVFLILE